MLKMVPEIYSQIIYLLDLTFNQDIIWIVYPLIIVTIITLVYFEKYRDESPKWDAHVSNSLVLIFISFLSFRQFFSLNGGGLANIALFPLKFATSLTTLILGFVILLVNFEHILPEKVSKEISSPLTLNIFSYVVILSVYSELPESWSLLLSLLIIFIIITLILNLLRIALKKFFLKLKKMKSREKIEDLKEKKKEIVCKKNDLECMERQLRKAELEKIKKQKKELKKIEKISKKI